MQKKIITLLLFLFVAIATQAQSFLVQGKVVDSASKQSLTGVVIIISKFRDTTQRYTGVSDAEGKFSIANVPAGTYRLETNYIGYKKTTRPIQVNESGFIPTFFLVENLYTVEGAEIVQRLPPVQVKGDTTEYNADAFKTNPDATGEDLVKKMPGISVENGKVQAQGEDVKRVLVDGKEFFGDDPTLALRTMPADMIDKVQVYDQMSDQSAFTGIDDGRSSKAINIITRPDRRNGTFGRVYGGYGTNSRYNAGMSLNVLSSTSRLSIMGLSNNINQQNFSSEDLLGVSGGSSSGGRGGGMSGMGSMGGPQAGSDFLVAQQSGVATSHSLGANYTAILSKKTKFTGSYFFNTVDNKNQQNLTRTNFLGRDSTLLYNEGANKTSQNFNHRINMRIEYTIDSNNSLVFTPKISLQANNSKNLLAGTSLLSSEKILNDINNLNGSQLSGYNINTNLLYRHRFAKKGRSISANGGAVINNQEGNNNLFSANTFYTLSTLSDTIDQIGNTLSNSSTYSGRLAYTEPIGTKGVLQLSYDAEYKNSIAEKNTFNFAKGTYSAIDSGLSNAFTNILITHRAGTDYSHNFSKAVTLSVGLEYQQVELGANQNFPNKEATDRVFTNVLPNAMLRLQFSEKNNLRIRYRTRTNAPTVTQLQNVPNNTNPLQLSIGNPNLTQELTHFVFSRYMLATPQKGRSLFIIAMAQSTQNYISNSTTVAFADTTVQGVLLNRGSQLTQPVNLNGYFNGRTFLMYGFPFRAIKSNVNSRTGVIYSRTPALINNRTNWANSTNISQSVTIGSNISKNLDFTISYTGNYTIVKNSLLPQLNNNFFFHTAGAKLNWIFWKNMVVRTDINQTLYAGLTEAFNQNFLLWNASIGKKFLKDAAGELSLSVFDVLNQNNSISRNVTQSYIEDNRTQVLNRYFMLTFTYTIKKFKAGKALENDAPEEKHGPNSHPRPMVP